MPTTGLFIKMNEKKLKGFKKHLEKEHPSVRGKVQIIIDKKKEKEKGLKSDVNSYDIDDDDLCGMM